MAGVLAGMILELREAGKPSAELRSNRSEAPNCLFGAFEIEATALVMSQLLLSPLPLRERVPEGRERGGTRRGRRCRHVTQDHCFDFGAGSYAAFARLSAQGVGMRACGSESCDEVGLGFQWRKRYRSVPQFRGVDCSEAR